MSEELDKIRQRCEDATPGPWVSFVEGRDHTSGSSFIRTRDTAIELRNATIADQDFIAHARQDIPHLLECAEQLDRMRARWHASVEQGVAEAKNRDKALTVCADAYQVVGALAHLTDTFDHPDIIRALDRFSDPLASTDEDLLPWPKSGGWNLIPRIGVGVIVCCPADKGIVWLHRAGTSHGNDEWSLPGGRLEFNETLEACAKREVLEEIGIVPDEIKPIGYISEDFFPEENMHWITHYFLAYSDFGVPKLMEPGKADNLIIADRPPGKIFPARKVRSTG